MGKEDAYDVQDAENLNESGESARERAEALLNAENRAKLGLLGVSASVSSTARTVSAPPRVTPPPGRSGTHEYYFDRGLDNVDLTQNFSLGTILRELNQIDVKLASGSKKFKDLTEADMAWLHQRYESGQMYWEPKLIAQHRKILKWLQLYYLDYANQTNKMPGNPPSDITVQMRGGDLFRLFNKAWKFFGKDMLGITDVKESSEQVTLSDAVFAPGYTELIDERYARIPFADFQAMGEDLWGTFEEFYLGPLSPFEMDLVKGDFQLFLRDRQVSIQMGQYSMPGESVFRTQMEGKKGLSGYSANRGGPSIYAALSADTTVTTMYAQFVTEFMAHNKEVVYNTGLLTDFGKTQDQLNAEARSRASAEKEQVQNLNILPADVRGLLTSVAAMDGYEFVREELAEIQDLRGGGRNGKTMESVVRRILDKALTEYRRNNQDIVRSSVFQQQKPELHRLLKARGLPLYSEIGIQTGKYAKIVKDFTFGLGKGLKSFDEVEDDPVLSHFFVKGVSPEFKADLYAALFVEETQGGQGRNIDSMQDKLVETVMKGVPTRADLAQAGDEERFEDLVDEFVRARDGIGDISTATQEDLEWLEARSNELKGTCYENTPVHEAWIDYCRTTPVLRMSFDQWLGEVYEIGPVDQMMYQVKHMLRGLGLQGLFSSLGLEDMDFLNKPEEIAVVSEMKERLDDYNANFTLKALELERTDFMKQIVEPNTANMARIGDTWVRLNGVEIIGPASNYERDTNYVTNELDADTQNAREAEMVIHSFFERGTEGEPWLRLGWDIETLRLVHQHRENLGFQRDPGSGEVQIQLMDEYTGVVTQTFTRDAAGETALRAALTTHETRVNARREAKREVESLRQLDNRQLASYFNNHPALAPGVTIVVTPVELNDPRFKNGMLQLAKGLALFHDPNTGDSVEGLGLENGLNRQHVLLLKRQTERGQNLTLDVAQSENVREELDDKNELIGGIAAVTMAGVAAMAIKSMGLKTIAQSLLGIAKKPNGASVPRGIPGRLADWVKKIGTGISPWRAILGVIALGIGAGVNRAVQNRYEDILPDIENMSVEQIMAKLGQGLEKLKSKAVDARDWALNALGYQNGFTVYEYNGQPITYAVDNPQNPDTNDIRRMPNDQPRTLISLGGGKAPMYATSLDGFFHSLAAEDTPENYLDRNHNWLETPPALEYPSVGMNYNTTRTLRPLFDSAGNPTNQFAAEIDSAGLIQDVYQLVTLPSGVTDYQLYAGEDADLLADHGVDTSNGVDLSTALTDSVVVQIDLSAGTPLAEIDTLVWMRTEPPVKIMFEGVELSTDRIANVLLNQAGTVTPDEEARAARWYDAYMLNGTAQATRTQDVLAQLQADELGPYLKGAGTMPQELWERLLFDQSIELKVNDDGHELDRWARMQKVTGLTPGSVRDFSYTALSGGTGGDFNRVTGPTGTQYVPATPPGSGTHRKATWGEIGTRMGDIGIDAAWGVGETFVNTPREILDFLIPPGVMKANINPRSKSGAMWVDVNTFQELWDFYDKY